MLNYIELRKIQPGHSMKFIFKPLLFVLFVLNFPLPSNADRMDDAIFVYDEGDYEAALAIFLPLANDGNNIAKGYVASSYMALEDFESLKKYIPEIEKLANSNDANFQYILASILRLDVDGIGDTKEAKRWLLSAAELGNKDATTALEDFDSDLEIDRLERNIALMQALSAVTAIVLALVVIFFNSFIGSGAQFAIREIFVIAVSFSLGQILIDAVYVMPALSSITTVMSGQLFFFLAIYLIIRKYLSPKIV
jgi:tetratricopeptide (TPR) repeat protein